MNEIWIIEYKDDEGWHVYEFFYTSPQNLSKAVAELIRSDIECGLIRRYRTTKLHDGGENA